MKELAWMVNYNATCCTPTVTYTSWLLILITLIGDVTEFEPSQLALTERELKAYYEMGLSPYNVFFDVWEQDAGNYYAM